MTRGGIEGTLVVSLVEVTSAVFDGSVKEARTGDLLSNTRPMPQISSLATIEHRLPK